MKVAYLVSQYPMGSHSFIRREIQAVERLGIEVLRISVRGWDEKLVDPEDVREREHTRYVLRVGAWALAFSVLGALVRSPGRFVAAFRLALAMAKHADRGQQHGKHAERVADETLPSGTLLDDEMPGVEDAPDGEGGA